MLLAGLLFTVSLLQPGWTSETECLNWLWWRRQKIITAYCSLGLVCFRLILKVCLVWCCFMNKKKIPKARWWNSFWTCFERGSRPVYMLTFNLLHLVHSFPALCLLELQSYCVILHLCIVKSQKYSVLLEQSALFDQHITSLQESSQNSAPLFPWQEPQMIIHASFIFISATLIKLSLWTSAERCCRAADLVTWRRSRLNYYSY